MLVSVLLVGGGLRVWVVGFCKIYFLCILFTWLVRPGEMVIKPPLRPFCFIFLGNAGMSSGRHCKCCLSSNKHTNVVLFFSLP